MTLEEIKKMFHCGWIAKDEDGNWSWYSEKPELCYDDHYWGYYWSGKDELEIGIIDGTVCINCLDSLIKVGE